MKHKFNLPAAVALALAAGVTAPVALANEPIPQEPGFGGFIVAGVAYTNLKSNFVAGNRMLDIGQPTFTSLDAAPSSDDGVSPAFNGEINYTFGNRWQAFFGTAIEDAITLDGVTQLGVRKDIADQGQLQVGYVFSGIPTQTWEDPYAEGVQRRETDRNSDGVRVQWDQALGTPFQFTFTYRDISIDRERSGQGVQSVTCGPSCQALLRRDGDQYNFDVSYLFRVGPAGGAPRHLFRPLVRYTVNDREGDAISNDGYRLQLSYVFMGGQGYTVASNVAYAATNQDRSNPLFGRKTDSTGYAADTTLFYRLPFQGWQAVGTLGYGKEDNDVRFHNNEVFIASLGAMYRFGSR